MLKERFFVFLVAMVALTVGAGCGDNGGSPTSPTPITPTSVAVEWSLNRGLFNFGPLNRGPAAVNRGLLAVVGRLSVRVEKAAAD